MADEVESEAEVDEVESDQHNEADSLMADEVESDQHNAADSLMADEVESDQHNAAADNLNRFSRDRSPRINERRAVRKANKEGESITHRLVLEMPIYPQDKTDIFEDHREAHVFDAFFIRDWFDAKDQRLLLPIEDPLTDETLKEMPMWCRSFPEDFNSKAKKRVVNKNDGIIEEDFINGTSGSAGVDDDWDPKLVNNRNACNIQPLTIDYLVERCKRGGRFWINAEWKSLKSPSEFYAFPLNVNVENARPEDLLRQLYKDQLQWDSQLNSFYGNPINRKPIDTVYVATACAREPIYAIYEVNDEFVNSSYRRVQILAIRRNAKSAQDIKSEFCRVRFLDTGGTTIVPLAGLLRIHSTHCEEMPRCMQLFASKIPPNNGRDWSEEERDQFKRLMRTDVPLHCRLTTYTTAGQLPPKYNDLPQRWPGVFDASDIKVYKSNITIENEMVNDNNIRRAKLVNSQ